MGQALPPRDETAESRYQDGQNALLKSYDVQFQSHYFQIISPSLRVHVLEAGHGEPALMIHGGDASASQWAPLMARLSKHVPSVCARPARLRADSNVQLQPDW